MTSIYSTSRSPLRLRSSSKRPPARAAATNPAVRVRWPGEPLGVSPRTVRWRTPTGSTKSSSKCVLRAGVRSVAPSKLTSRRPARIARSCSKRSPTSNPKNCSPSSPGETRAASSGPLAIPARAKKRPAIPDSKNSRGKCRKAVGWVESSRPTNPTPRTLVGLAMLDPPYASPPPSSLPTRWQRPSPPVPNGTSRRRTKARQPIWPSPVIRKKKEPSPRQVEARRTQTAPQRSHPPSPLGTRRRLRPLHLVDDPPSDLVRAECAV